MFSLEIAYGIQSINHLVHLISSEDPLKLLLVTAIECHQLEAYVEQLFLSSSHAKLHTLAKSSWTTHLWEFLHVFCLEACLPILNLPSSSCVNYVTIVDKLLSLDWRN